MLLTGDKYITCEGGLNGKSGKDYKHASQPKQFTKTPVALICILVKAENTKSG